MSRKWWDCGEPRPCLEGPFYSAQVGFSGEFSNVISKALCEPTRAGLKRPGFYLLIICSQSFVVTEPRTCHFSFRGPEGSFEHPLLQNRKQ